MIEVTKFKLYPDRETEDKLFSNLRICSFVYNWCLEHSVWKDSVLPQLKEVYPDSSQKRQESRKEIKEATAKTIQKNKGKP